MALALAGAWLAGSGGGAAAGGPSRLVSRTASGQAAAGTSGEASISGDGMLVSFSSEAADLVAADTNGVSDVFLLDRRSGAIRRLSRRADGTEPPARSLMPALSADGRWLAFRSDAPLTPEAAPMGGLYLLELASGALRLVAADTADGRGRNDFPAIAEDGGVVAFESTVPGPGEAADQPSRIVVWRRADGTLRTVSPTGADGPAREAAVSADGAVVAWVSAASNVLPGAGGGFSQVYVTRLATGETRRASVRPDGAAGGGGSTQPTLSGDGAVVAFTSLASDLVAKDVNGVTDLFVRDLAAGRTVAVTEVVPADDVYHPGDSSEPVLSRDGTVLAFASKMYTLTPGDGNRELDVYRMRLDTGALERISLRRDGSESARPSWAPALSADGRWVAFTSEGALAPQDGNDQADVYVWGADEPAQPTPAGHATHLPTDAPTATPHGTHEPTATPAHGPTATSLHHHPTATAPHHGPTATSPHHPATPTSPHHGPTATSAHHPPTPTSHTGGAVPPAGPGQAVMPALLRGVPLPSPAIGPP
jgi:Tol biopolymer transport system component